MMRARLVISAAALLTLFLPFQARANSFDLRFLGPGVSGTVELTYGTATDAKYPQALEITGISGVFSDSNNSLGIVDAQILGLIPIRHDSPEATNLLAPADFSRFRVATGLSPMENGFLTYDNLLYPGGSPQTASDYPVHGGLLDIYGLMFSIGNGRVVDFWSNGGNPANYGVAVATSDMALDYVGRGVAVTPEPEALGLVGTGLLGVLTWYRRRSGWGSLQD